MLLGSDARGRGLGVLLERALRAPRRLLRARRDFDWSQRSHGDLRAASSRPATTPTPGTPTTRCSSRCVRTRARSSASCRSTSRSAAGARPTTSSSCSSAMRRTSPSRSSTSRRGRGARQRASVEHLLRVSAQLDGRASAEEMLDAVCAGVARRWASRRSCSRSTRATGASTRARSAAGRPPRSRSCPQPTVAAMAALLDPALEREGCILLEREEAAGGVAPQQLHGRLHVARNGRGPRRLEPPLAGRPALRPRGPARRA